MSYLLASALCWNMKLDDFPKQFPFYQFIQRLSCDILNQAWSPHRWIIVYSHANWSSNYASLTTCEIHQPVRGMTSSNVSLSDLVLRCLWFHPVTKSHRNYRSDDCARRPMDDHPPLCNLSRSWLDRLIFNAMHRPSRRQSIVDQPKAGRTMKPPPPAGQSET